MIVKSPLPKFIAKSSVLATVLAALGCSTLVFGVRDRAETAFRRQNQLSAEFMLAAADIESKAPARYESLLAVEQLMLDACQPLNTAASNQRNGDPLSIHEKKAILRSLEVCEKATSNFEKSLRPAQAQSTEL